MFMIPLSEDDFWPLKVVKRLYKKAVGTAGMAQHSKVWCGGELR